MKLATYGWCEKEQRYKTGGKGPVLMRETETPGHYESVGVFPTYEAAARVVKAANAFEAMREALRRADTLTAMFVPDDPKWNSWVDEIRHAIKLSEEA